MMNMKKIAPLLFISLLLAGCNKPTPVASCSSPDTQKIIGGLITEHAAKLTADKKYDYYDGSFVFGGIKVRALLDQFHIAVENINTLKEDAANNQKLCSGLLTVTIPTNILADANQAGKNQHEAEIGQYAAQFNIENSANVFTQDIEYNVQLIDKGKTQHIEIEDAGWANVLDRIVTLTLLKPVLDVEVSDQTQLNKPPKQDTASLKPETDQVKSDDDGLRDKLRKQGLEKLNKELLEADQVAKEMLQERANQQVATVPSAGATEQVSPSFNCSKAGKPTEVTICTHPDLAALDVKNSDLYLKAKSINAIATKEIWKESIKSKYACGTDVSCIKKVYNQSIQDYGCIGAGKAPEDCAADVDQ